MRKEKGKRDLEKKETEIRYNFISVVYLEERSVDRFFSLDFLFSHIEPTSAIQKQQHQKKKKKRRRKKEEEKM